MTQTVVTITPSDTITSELASVSVTAQALADLKSKYLSLKITGVDDKIRYEMAFNGTKEIRKYINAVETKRKELNSNHKKIVDNAAEKIAGELQPIFDHLNKEVSFIDSENARIAKEKAEAEERERNKAVEAERARLAEKEAELNRKQAQLEELAKSLGVELNPTPVATDKVTEVLNSVEGEANAVPNVDRELLTKWAQKVASARLPEVTSDKGKVLIEKIKGMLTRLSEFVVTETDKF